VREQATNLLQRLLIVTSRVPIRLASGAHSEPPPSSGAHLSRISTKLQKSRHREAPNRDEARARQADD
jgi:hypothetical protein